MYEINEGVVTKILGLVDQGLSHGKGVQEPGRMCVEAVVCFALGLPHGDNPPCVGYAVRSVKIQLNDKKWSSKEARGKGLRRVAIAQLGSDVLDQVEFTKRLAEQTIRKIVPIALRAAAKVQKSGEHRLKLRAAADKCAANGTRESALEGRAYADADADAADAAAAYAAAYAAAAYAAYAAAAAADAAYAAAAAADAAYAAAAAADAADARAKAKDEILSDFAEIIVQVLIEMKSPGCQWLYLTEQ